MRDMAFFHSLAHISREKRSDLHENFTTDISLDNDVPTKFWKSSRSGVPSGFGPDLLLCRRSARALVRLVVCVCRRQLYCEYSGMWDNMEHRRNTIVQRLGCWNVEHRSTEHFLQVLIRMLLAATTPCAVHSLCLLYHAQF